MRSTLKIVLLAIAAFGSLLSAGGAVGQAADTANGIEGVWAGVLGGPAAFGGDDHEVRQRRAGRQR